MSQSSNLTSLPHYYPWQEKQWHQVFTQWQAQKLPHAFLLAGARDLGKRTFAKALAARILCNSQGEAACGFCQSCNWILAGTHPDLFYLQPDEDAKTAVIKIEAVRTLVESLNQTAQQGKNCYQVVIIEPAEALNKAAANALLKTLEEPSGQVIFLLVTHQAAALLPTIRSRCQRLDFFIPSLEMGLLWLQQQIPAQENLQLILQLAEHIPLRALTFVQQGRFTLQTYNKIVTQFVHLHSGQSDPLQMAVTCIEQEYTDVFDTLWSVALDLVRLKSGATAIINMHQYTALYQMALSSSFEQIFSFIDGLLKGKQHMEAKINLNMQLMFEAWFVKWNQYKISHVRH